MYQTRNKATASTHGLMGVSTEGSGKTENSTDLASIQLSSATRTTASSRNRSGMGSGLMGKDSAGSRHPKRQICISSLTRLKNRYSLSKRRRCSDDLRMEKLASRLSE